MTTETQDGRLSRRKFITAGAGLTFVVLLDPWGCKRKVKSETKPAAEADQAGKEATELGAWVVVQPDDSIVIYNPAAEMGQGSMTALPLILAEEMDADWEKVRIEHAPVDPSVYGRSWRRGGAGSMMTVGSRAVSGYFMKLRFAGAGIRRALMENAAKAWEVPIAELSTEPNAVVHEKSGRRMSYGEIAATGSVPATMPEVDESALKSPEDFRLIGRSMPRHDVPGKTDGSAEFALDLQMPEMVYGMIQRSPVHNGRPSSHNAEEIRGRDGITTTVELDHGVGILGTSVHAVLAARSALKVQWADGAPAAEFDSEKALAGYPKIASDDSVASQAVTDQGDAEGALKKAATRVEAGFFADHTCHAQMEPLNSVVWVRESGAVDVWVGTQAPAVAKSGVARALGIDAERVNINRTYLGGGFGRRSADDFVVEAAQLSNAVKKPVKLIWTREDDMQYGMMRPMCFQKLQAGIDDGGEVTAWTHTIVGDGGRLLTSGIEIPFYDIPNQKIELKGVSHGVRLHYWRSVGHPFNKFAIEAFVDELAAAQDVDPVEFRRMLMRRSPRAAKVLNRVAEMASWGEEAEGRAKGVAVIDRSGAIAAGVAEISVDEKSGEIRVHNFWAAVDAGIIVQPDNARAQVEGSIVMGLSSALTERITFKGGRVQQSNYSDFSILRMSQTPEIEVAFIDSHEPPNGIGEPAVPIVAGAVANAFARLTGKKLRHMPFTRARVKEVLA